MKRFTINIKTNKTILLLVVVLLVIITGCKFNFNNEGKNDKIDSEITPGAWQTEMYFPLIRGKRIALAGNHTSTIKNVHIVDSLLSAGINVVKVFSPEHGFRGEAAAGEHIRSGTDSKTGLPVISLYGSNRRPNPFHLTDVDIILFDIQDVGARFYTYISTMTYIMEAAATLGIPIILLDRPNPNRHYVDGPVLETAYSSFVGLHPVPVVYGMTIGEYALMVNNLGWLGENIKCELNIVAVKNYDKDRFYEPPILPSPNLPNIRSIYLYPSLCFFEGTPISVGRGTDFPFQVFGHSLFSPDYFSFSYTPVSRREAPNPPEMNKKCFGMDLRETDIIMIRDKSEIDLSYLITAYENFPDKDKFFNNFFNLLAGNNTLKEQIKNGLSAEEIRESWQKDLEEFKKVRKKFLLYHDFAD